MVTETIKVGGMMCAACVRAVERAVSKIEGVEYAAVNLATETVRVSYDGSAETMARIKQAIIDEDYEVIEPDAVVEETKEPWLTDQRRLIICIILTLCLLTVSMGPMIGLGLPDFLSPEKHMLRYGIVQMILAAAVMSLNLRVYRTGFKSLIRRSPGMDALIAVGTSASFLYSLYRLIRIAEMPAGHIHDADLYFESCGTILTFVLLGKYLENRAKRKTNLAVQKLQNLAPKTAAVLQGETQIEVPLETVLPDDRVVVKPGARIPVDGTILQGTTRVDESMLTGESQLILKQENDSVIGGSQNVDGMIIVKAEKDGNDTMLSQIIRMVQEAQGTKAPIARLADKVAGVFVPVVMSIAVIAALIWLLCGAEFNFALRIFVTVLVIACPCALGLATPTAVMVGTGAAAERGLLFKDGETLERLSSVRRVIFDKTGTITEGKPQVADVRSDRMDPDELLRISACAEQYSEHLIAGAIVREAQARGLTLSPAEDFTAEPGQGIHAVVEGKTVIIGNAGQLSGIENIPEDDSENTRVYVAVDGEFCGSIALSDMPRANSAAAVTALKERHAEPVMLSGDTPATARKIAAMVGIERVFAGVLPTGKAQVVSDLASDGILTAMVGDGINDAPALAAADIGIAVASGTDIAIEAADLVLMKNDPLDVVRGMKISEITIRNIRQNLFWAFAFNTIGIPIAAGVLYPVNGLLLNPMIAAAAMSCSSVFVVSNALRIRSLIRKMEL